MLHHLIEADSETSYDEALNLALEQAALLTGTLHDAQVMVTDLSFREDQYYHCEVEITLIAAGLAPEMDEATGEFKPVEPEMERDYRIILTRGRETLRKVIDEYLKDRTYVNLDRLPDFILARIRPEDLLNKIVIHDFQDAVDTAEPELSSEILDEFQEAWQEVNPAMTPDTVIPPDEQPKPEPE